MMMINMLVEEISFLESLEYMGLGLLGIFCVTGIIVLSIKLLNFAMKDRPKKNKKGDAAPEVQQ